jgi:hypothetical protein
MTKVNGGIRDQRRDGDTVDVERDRREPLVGPSSRQG